MAIRLTSCVLVRNHPIAIHRAPSVAYAIYREGIRETASVIFTNFVGDLPMDLHVRACKLIGPIVGHDTCVNPPPRGHMEKALSCSWALRTHDSW